MEKEKEAQEITRETILLDLVEKYEEAGDILGRYDAQAGECILCYNLFEPLKTIFEKYGLNEAEIMAALKALEGK